MYIVYPIKFRTYHRVCIQINTTGVPSGAGTVYPSGAPEFTPGLQWGSCFSIFSFMCMYCRSLFVLLSFFFWPLWCLFFFDIRILITPLVSSNSSYRILKYYLKQCALNVLVKCWYFICIYMYRYPVSLLCNHTIQQFVSHLRQVGGFLRVLRYN